MIFSVMAMIILINITSNKLFLDGDASVQQTSGEQYLLTKHAVILSLAIKGKVLIKRDGSSWKIMPEQMRDILTTQGLEQLMMVWQHSQGLLQASSIEIKGLEGIEVIIEVAGESNAFVFTLYGLEDQLLIHKQATDAWLAFPAQILSQLIPF